MRAVHRIKKRRRRVNRVLPAKRRRDVRDEIELVVVPEGVRVRARRP